MSHQSIRFVLPLLLYALPQGALQSQDLPTVPNGYSVTLFAGQLDVPAGFDFDPNGNLIVCTWDGDGVYSVASGGARAPIALIPRSFQPAIASDGRVFVTAGGSSVAGKIWEIVEGEPKLFYEGQGALGIQWNGDGYLYFTQSPTGSILRSDLNGNVNVFASGLGVGITGLRFGPDEHLYVANNDSGTIFRVDPNGGVQPYLTGLPRPEMLAFDSSGDLYFTSFNFGKVYRVDANKNVSLFLSGVSDSDYRGLGFDASGNLFASDGGRGVIYRITASASVPGMQCVTRQVGPRCVSVDLTNNVPIKGGEIGIAYDPSKVLPLKVSPGPDFPLNADLHSNLNAPVACTGESNVTAGLTVAWLNSISEASLMAPGKHELLRICFTPAEGVELGDCSDLSFVTCLGPQEAPVRNIVTDKNDKSVALATSGGTVCIQEELPFRRGDSNADGNFDVSDPISILGCLFIGTDCSRCADASDANDDGAVNIADPAYLLNWRFLGGSSPPTPFSECGPDPTSDALDECEESPGCP